MWEGCSVEPKEEAPRENWQPKGHGQGQVEHGDLAGGRRTGGSQCHSKGSLNGPCSEGGGGVW